MKLITMSAIIVALASLSVPQICLADASEISFKGIVLGKATEKDVLEKFNGAKRYGAFIFAKPSYNADAICGTLTDSLKNPSILTCRSEAMASQLFRIGQTSAGEFIFTDKDGTIEEVSASFSTSSFEAVLAALIEKYGKPTSQESERVQNKIGTTFNSMSATWKLSDGTLVVRERSGKVDTMSLQIFTNKIVNSRKEESLKSIKDAAKNL